MTKDREIVIVLAELRWDRVHQENRKEKIEKKNKANKSPALLREYVWGQKAGKTFPKNSHKAEGQKKKGRRGREKARPQEGGSEVGSGGKRTRTGGGGGEKDVFFNRISKGGGGRSAVAGKNQGPQQNLESQGKIKGGRLANGGNGKGRLSSALGSAGAYFGLGRR